LDWLAKLLAALVLFEVWAARVVVGWIWRFAPKTVQGRIVVTTNRTKLNERMIAFGGREKRTPSVLGECTKANTRVRLRRLQAGLGETQNGRVRQQGRFAESA
jgi:hypothetical protein